MCNFLFSKYKEKEITIFLTRCVTTTTTVSTEIKKFNFFNERKISISTSMLTVIVEEGSRIVYKIIDEPESKTTNEMY